MTNRRFEMYQYRHALARMRQGDSDRDIARSKLMGRKKIAAMRETAQRQGWLDPGTPLPDDTQLAAVFGRREAAPRSRCVSTLEPWREQVAHWFAAGVQGTTIHATLRRNHGYTGSYSSVYRFLPQLAAQRLPEVPLRLELAPVEATQVDFGAVPSITDVHTGEVFKTWFFVMTLYYSRHQYAEFVLDQTVAT
jgi:transposase